LKNFPSDENIRLISLKPSATCPVSKTRASKMGLSFLGLSAVGWHDMTDNWWDQLIAAFLLATFVLGSGYIIYNVIRFYMKRPSVS
jgi:hypothetical protein